MKRTNEDSGNTEHHSEREIYQAFINTARHSQNQVLRLAALNASRAISIEQAEEERSRKRARLQEFSSFAQSLLQSSAPADAKLLRALKRIHDFEAFSERVYAVHANNGYFSALPDEICARIMECANSARTCAYVCRRFRDIVHSFQLNTSQVAWWQIRNVSQLLEGKINRSCWVKLGTMQWCVQVGDVTNDASRRRFSLYAVPQTVSQNNSETVRARYSISLVNLKNDLSSDVSTLLCSIYCTFILWLVFFHPLLHAWFTRGCFILQVLFRPCFAPCSCLAPGCFALVSLLFHPLTS
eukprot:TRINITY_DN6328_c0_g1_i2.p1 TRINITY_DN6328_c0_g1~~TRINITY_DN6328_c0_g1_i2.p1  ORF type:complete len:324 (-),score=8.72 TRINITY_DN6328_c0_g1_i2:19-912(-)